MLDWTKYDLFTARIRAQTGDSFYDAASGRVRFELPQALIRSYAGKRCFVVLQHLAVHYIQELAQPATVLGSMDVPIHVRLSMPSGPYASDNVLGPNSTVIAQLMPIISDDAADPDANKDVVHIHTHGASYPIEKNENHAETLQWVNQMTPEFGVQGAYCFVPSGQTVELQLWNVLNNTGVNCYNNANNVIRPMTFTILIWVDRCDCN